MVLSSTTVKLVATEPKLDGGRAGEVRFR